MCIRDSGETDPRCPVAESRNFVKALNEAGKIQGEDFEYVEIPDQGHGMYTDQVSRIRDAKLISSYIMKHLWFIKMNPRKMNGLVDQIYRNLLDNELTFRTMDVFVKT